MRKFGTTDHLRFFVKLFGGQINFILKRAADVWGLDDTNQNEKVYTPIYLLIIGNEHCGFYTVHVYGCVCMCGGGGGGEGRSGGGECIKQYSFRQYSFYNTQHSVQQTESSDAGNRVSTVLTAQSSSLDHQMQATEFPQYSPLSPAAWTIKCRQQSFHSTHRSVQQPGPSNAGTPPRCSPCGRSPAQPDCQAVAAGLTWRPAPSVGQTRRWAICCHVHAEPTTTTPQSYLF